MSRFLRVNSDPIYRSSVCALGFRGLLDLGFAQFSLFHRENHRQVRKAQEDPNLAETWTRAIFIGVGSPRL